MLQHSIVSLTVLYGSNVLQILSCFNFKQFRITNMATEYKNFYKITSRIKSRPRLPKYVENGQSLRLLNKAK